MFAGCTTDLRVLNWVTKWRDYNGIKKRLIFQYLSTLSNVVQPKTPNKQTESKMKFCVNFNEILIWKFQNYVQKVHGDEPSQNSGSIWQ